MQANRGEVAGEGLGGGQGKRRVEDRPHHHCGSRSATAGRVRHEQGVGTRRRSHRGRRIGGAGQYPISGRPLVSSSGSIRRTGRGKFGSPRTTIQRRGRGDGGHGGVSGRAQCNTLPAGAARSVVRQPEGIHPWRAGNNGVLRSLADDRRPITANPGSGQIRPYVRLAGVQRNRSFPATEALGRINSDDGHVGTALYGHRIHGYAAARTRYRKYVSPGGVHSDVDSIGVSSDVTVRRRPGVGEFGGITGVFAEDEHFRDITS